MARRAADVLSLDVLSLSLRRTSITCAMRVSIVASGEASPAPSPGDEISTTRGLDRLEDGGDEQEESREDTLSSSEGAEAREKEEEREHAAFATRGQRVQPCADMSASKTGGRQLSATEERETANGGDTERECGNETSTAGALSSRTGRRSGVDGTGERAGEEARKDDEEKLR